MSKFHTVSEGTLSCGIGVINAFGLYCDEDDKTNQNIVIVSYGGAYLELNSNKNLNQVLFSLLSIDLIEFSLLIFLLLVTN